MAYHLLFALIFVTNAYCVKAVSVGELESRIDAVEKQCAAQNVQFKEENQKLRNELEQLRATVMKQDAQLQDEIKDLRQVAVEKIKHIGAGQKRGKRFVIDENETVAFHATLTGGRAIQHLHINQTIIFNNVMLNIGGAYHSQHGLFVANVKGIYIFSVSIMGLYGGTDSTMVFIMKNGKEVAAAIADGRGGTHDQGSTTVVLQLVPGDEVWVSVQRHDDTAIWTDSLDSFMGCLITYT
ncbi:cerebellin-2-like [Mercenaria mercenaria]|uniref:cerebellin-2-like n=1 Tax=Mercenaria mercenaria TaxID=6596 RepID=UPI00234F9DCE|nr:cerebellin-2-like [Mercenaria mercenaria]